MLAAAETKSERGLLPPTAFPRLVKLQHRPTTTTFSSISFSAFRQRLSIMCGISTVVVLSPPDKRQNGDSANQDGAQAETKQRLRDEMQESLDIIKHRGPDASGVWISEDERVGTASLDNTTEGSRNMTD